jgi:hypothetical protein
MDWQVVILLALIVRLVLIKVIQAAKVTRRAA